MIADRDTFIVNSHFMALTCQCGVNSDRRERHTFSHLDLLVTPPEFLMTYGHPEGPSCSRNSINRSSFYELPHTVNSVPLQNPFHCWSTLKKTTVLLPQPPSASTLYPSLPPSPPAVLPCP